MTEATAPDSPTEPPIDLPDTFPASNVVAARLKANDPGFRGPRRVENKRQQGNLQRYLARHPAAARHAGLRSIAVPEGVHDVTQGRAPHGDLDYCDVIAALHPLRDGERVLDFGCSSGRVVRNLHATHPGIAAEGCDPREASIAFIREHVPEVRWFVSHERPPLPGVEDARYDLVFAVSVWSHFSEPAALAWFAEMARVVKPGGELLFTTHGARSIYHHETVRGHMPAPRAQERREAMARGEMHFRTGAHADLNDDWGVAYIPRAWLERHLADTWRVRAHGSGMAKRNQDVYVLTRS